MGSKPIGRVRLSLSILFFSFLIKRLWLGFRQFFLRMQLSWRRRVLLEMHMGSLFTHTSLVSSSTRVPTVPRAPPHRVARALETRVIAARRDVAKNIQFDVFCGRRVARRDIDASRARVVLTNAPLLDARRRRCCLTASCVSQCACREQPSKGTSFVIVSAQDPGVQKARRAPRRRFVRRLRDNSDFLIRSIFMEIGGSRPIAVLLVLSTLPLYSRARARRSERRARTMSRPRPAR